MRRRGIAAEEVGWLQPALNNARYRAEDNGIVLDTERLDKSVARDPQQQKSAGVLHVADDIAVCRDVAAECEHLGHLGSAVLLAQLMHADDGGIFFPERKGRYPERPERKPVSLAVPSPACRFRLRESGARMTSGSAEANERGIRPIRLGYAEYIGVAWPFAEQDDSLRSWRQGFSIGSSELEQVERAVLERSILEVKLYLPLYTLPLGMLHDRGYSPEGRRQVQQAPASRQAQRRIGVYSGTFFHSSLHGH